MHPSIHPLSYGSHRHRTVLQYIQNKNLLTFILVTAVVLLVIVTAISKSRILLLLVLEPASQSRSLLAIETSAYSGLSRRRS